MYVLKRVGQAVVTLVSVITITFVLIRSIPGGPADYIRAQVMQSQGASGVDMSQLNSLVESYTNVDPSTPIYVQYWDYLTNILQGNLGQSVWYGRPVSDIILQALPWTLFLLTIAILLSFSVGIVLGAAMAYFEGSNFDTGWTVTSMYMNSVPYYIAAIFLVYVFAIQLGWFPQSGNVSSGAEASLSVSYIVDVLHHSILPIASLALTGFGGTAITMRGNAIQEIGEDYIRVANLRGVPGGRIAVRYVGRNAILPMYTSLMISIGFMFGGSVILEQIFAYPGLGYYLLQSINARDYPLMMGIFLIIAVAVLICILIADLTYSRIDPRISDNDAGEAY